MLVAMVATAIVLSASPPAGQPGVSLPGGIWPWVVIAAIAVIGGAIPTTAKARRGKGSRDATIGEFRAVDGVLSAAEADFLPVLRAAVGAHLPNGPTVLMKVRLADIVSPPRDSPTWQADINRVSAKHVDFVICAGGRMLPMRVVELDDSSHERAARRERDELVDLVLKRAGIPVTHIRWQRSYRVEEVRRMLG